MRLSPSFDNMLPDFSPRPSIPLESVDLGSLKYAPPKLVVKSEEVKKPSMLHLQSVDTSSFFKPSAQPKPSLPTLSHPKIKVTPPRQKPAIIKIIPTPIPVKQVVPVVKPPPPVKHIQQPIPIQVASPVPKLPPVEKNNLAALKKVVQSIIKPNQSPIKYASPPKSAPEPVAKPISLPPSSPPHPVDESKSELKKLNSELNEILNTPTIHIAPKVKISQPVLIPPAKPLPNPVEEKPVEKKEPSFERVPDIQDLVSKELEKVIPPTHPIDFKKPTPEPTKSLEEPKFPEPSNQSAHPFQKPALSHITTPSQLKPSQPNLPAHSPALPKPSIFASYHLLDFFLIRVNPKLNPYKSQTRGRIILGVKISGLVLFALGVFIIISSFVSGFSLNVIFEALSTLTISGILLFLGENLNMFFEPINPYKVREVV